MNIRSKNKVLVSFSMSSMTDVVFLLLIFFMVTSTLVSPNAIKLLFPQKNIDQVEEDPPKEITLSVKQEPDNSYSYKIDKTKVSNDDLENKLVQEFENVENAVVILKTDDNVPVEEAVRIIDMVKDYEFRIIFSMQPN